MGAARRPCDGVWGGHSCPQPLKLFLNLVERYTVNVKGGGRVSAPHGCLRRRNTAAELGAQARELLAVFGLVGEEFHPIQVNAAIADFAADPDRLIGVGRPEFDLDLASYGQVGGGEKTNSAFAETHTTAINDCSFS